MSTGARRLTLAVLAFLATFAFDGSLASMGAVAGLLVAALAMLGLADRPDRKPPGTPPWPYRPATGCRAVVLERIEACGLALPVLGGVELPPPANDVGVPLRNAA